MISIGKTVLMLIVPSGQGDPPCPAYPRINDEHYMIAEDSYYHYYELATIVIDDYFCYKKGCYIMIVICR